MQGNSSLVRVTSPLSGLQLLVRVTAPFKSLWWVCYFFLVISVINRASKHKTQTQNKKLCHCFFTIRSTWFNERIRIFPLSNFEWTVECSPTEEVNALHFIFAKISLCGVKIGFRAEFSCSGSLSVRHSPLGGIDLGN